MEIQEFVGSKVWVKRRGLPDHVGHITAVSKPVLLEDIASTVIASTFSIKLASGDAIETTGVNILKIEHAGYPAALLHATPGLEGRLEGSRVWRLPVRFSFAADRPEKS